MPDLLELARQAIYKDPATPGVMQSLKGFLNPLAVVKGATWDVGKGALDAMGGAVLNAAQALSPVKVPGATDETFDPTAGFQPIQRVGALGNAALMGLPDILAKRINEEYSADKPKNLEGHVENIGAGVAKFALKDILPGQEIKELALGQDDSGRPLESSDVGRLIATGLLKASMLKGGGKAIANAHQKLARYLPEESRVAKTITAGEINAAKNLKESVTSKVVPIADDATKPSTTLVSGEAAGDLGDAARAAADDAQPRLSPEAAALVEETLPPGQSEFKQTRSLLSSEENRAVAANASTSAIAKQVLEDAAKSGTTLKPNEIIARVVEQGGLADAGNLALRISERHGVPLPEVNTYIAKAIRETATEGGEILNAFSQAADMFEGGLRLEAQQGSINALRALRDLKRADTLSWDKVKGWGQGWRWFTNLSNEGIERFRRGAMTSQLPTASRNLTGAGVTSILQVVEDFVTGVGEATTGRLKGDGRKMGDYFGDVLSDFGAAASRLSPEGRGQLEAVLNSLPFTKARMLGDNASLAFDSNLSVLQNWRKGLKPEGLGEWSEATTSALNIANNLQEMQSRRLFFRARLDANLKSIGKTWDELHQAANSTGEGAFEPFRQVVADAEEHALKQTYAFMPDGPGPAQAMLNVYKQIPFSTALLPSFPRFLANQFRWQMERSPALFLDLFSPEFRDLLYKGAEGGLASKNAQRQMGRATSGLFLTNAAYALRGDERAGPKYYQWDAGTKNERGEKEYFDLRPYQPFVSYLFLADWLHGVQKGQRPDIDANEMLDAMTGVRRLGEVPVFALPDILRAASSDNPDTFWKALQTPIGQWIGSFFTPANQLREAYGVMGNDEANIRRDTTGQELIGPAMSAIPAVSEALPPRVSPFSGEPMKAEHPGLHLLTGMTKSSQSALSALVSQSGLQVGDIAGNFGDPAVNNLVREKMGQILTMGDSLVGNRIAESISSMNLKEDIQKHELQKIFTELREKAVEAAMKEKPELFLDHEIDQKVPTQTLKKLTRDYLESRKP